MSDQENELAKCPECNRLPRLMRLGGFFYECCGTMGSFPPAENEKQARDDWNIRLSYNA